MTNNYERKIVYGMSKIHIAPAESDGSFGTPVPIIGAKSVEASFETVEKVRYGDNKAVHSKKKVTNGSGKLSVMGLTTDEKCLLSGEENMSGGFRVNENTNAPRLAVLFQQEKEDGGKILNVIYNAQFSIPSINAVSSEGEDTDQTFELDFTCLPELTGGNFAYVVDSTDAKADETMVENWFTEVQMPKATSLPASLKNK